MRRALMMICCLLAAGCTADRRPAAAPAPAPSPAPSPSCPASADIAAGGLGIPERQGVGTGVTFWALFFGGKLTVGKEIKVAWRMTGTGPLDITATSATGKIVKPVWGPEAHSGSSFRRPGDEWGTGWVFPAAGCWTVNATRTIGTATLAIRVA
jgi:hypothetical protein